MPNFTSFAFSIPNSQDVNEPLLGDRLKWDIPTILSSHKHDYETIGDLFPRLELELGKLKVNPAIKSKCYFTP